MGSTRGEGSTRGVRSLVGLIFSQIYIKPIEIGFLLIRTNAHRLRLVFRSIAVRFFAVSLISLKKKTFFILFYFNLKIRLLSPMYTTCLGHEYT